MRRKILYTDLPGFKPLPVSYILQLAAFDCEVIAVTDMNAGLKTLENCHDIDILTINGPCLELARKFKEKQPRGKTVLMTDLAMDTYARALNYQEDYLVDHVIASLDQQEWSIGELRTTLQKIIRADVFGIDKYLLPTTAIHSRSVTDSSCRERLNTEVMLLAELHKLGAPMAKLAYGICEELLMNAIYDAPVASGDSVYGDLPRSTSVILAPHEYSTLEFGCDGRSFAIAVRDPFGALTKEKFFEYLKKVLRRSEGSGIIDKKKGGAGLGLFKILYSCHALICNSAPGKQTEVIALMNIHAQLRDFSKMPRSIHFFQNPPIP